MKNIISMIIVLAIVVIGNWNPPVGVCGNGEVYRCERGFCYHSSIDSPDIYEDGVMIEERNNDVSCAWECQCVQRFEHQKLENILNDVVR